MSLQEECKNEKNKDKGQLVIVSCGENKAAVAELFRTDVNYLDWDRESILEMLDTDVPDYFTFENVHYVEEKMKSLGADVYIAEEEDYIYIKIISAGKNRERVLDILDDLVGYRLEFEKFNEIEGFLNCLPLYEVGVYEYLDERRKRLIEAGAEAVLLSAADYEAEVSTGEEEVNTSNEEINTSNEEKCKNCGADIMPGTKFCEFCGAKV